MKTKSDTICYNCVNLIIKGVIICNDIQRKNKRCYMHPAVSLNNLLVRQCPEFKNRKNESFTGL